jgi:hypothetical protein
VVEPDAAERQARHLDGVADEIGMQRETHRLLLGRARRS